MPILYEELNPLRCFSFHGLDLRLTGGGSQHLGECPFCGKEKLYVEAGEGKWDCKTCGLSGNPLTFLRQLHTSGISEGLETLAGERGILDPDTLTAWGVTRSHVTGDWLVPGYNVEGEIHNLYRYVKHQTSKGDWKQRLMPTPGVHEDGSVHGVHGVPLFDPKKRTVYIAEGVWDGMVLWEIIGEEANVLAVPGDHVFRKVWAALLAGYDVVLLYDSDHPPTIAGRKGIPSGLAGMQKATRVLLSSDKPPKSVSYLAWGAVDGEPEGPGYHPELPSGTDVRDVLIDYGDTKGKRVGGVAWLLGQVRTVPTSWEEEAKKVHQPSKTVTLRPMRCETWEELLVAWGKGTGNPMRWRQELSDVLATMMAIAVSTEQTGDQLFLQVVAEPGCIHADTPIHDPVSGITETVGHRWEKGQWFHVWTKMPDGSVGVSWAMTPKRFPVEPLYKVTFRSGREVTVTLGHRFWDGQRYISAREIYSALLECGPYRLPSTSGPVLSAHAEDARRSMRTVRGSQGSYSECSCPCGGLLQSAKDAALDGPPSRDGAHRHTRVSSRRDALVGEDKRTLQQWFDLLAKLGCLHQKFGPRHLGIPQPSSHTSSRSLSDTRTDGHTPQRSPRTCTGVESASPYSGGASVDVDQPVRASSDSYVLNTHTLRRFSQLLRLSALPCTSLGSPQQSAGPSGSARFVSSVQGMGIPQSIVGGEDAVIKVEFAGNFPYFDFHVIGTNNYLACGVFHHNTGKSQLADALVVSKRCFALEHLTGFHSGYRDSSGKDFSLLARINRKCLVTSEGDVLMNSPQFDEIMAQQRRIFDGVSSKSYKTMAEEQRYEGLRTPWIICGTPAMMVKSQAQLGDRFLRVCLDPPGAKEEDAILMSAARSAWQSVRVFANGSAESSLPPGIAKARCMTAGYLEHLLDGVSAKIRKVGADEDDLFRYCSVLGRFTADYRARPDADTRKDSDAVKELPTRLTKQLIRLATCLAVVLGKTWVDNDVLRVVRKVAIDTARGRTLDIARHLFTVGETGCQAGALSVHVRDLGDEERVKRWLYFMRKVGVVIPFSQETMTGIRLKNVPPSWKLSPRARRLFKLVIEQQEE